MIKLKDILKELQVKPQRITLEKVAKYFDDNIWIIYYNTDYNEMWIEYIEICKPYIKKYNVWGWLDKKDFKLLSQSELNKIYKDMRTLVRKHVSTEKL